MAGQRRLAISRLRVPNLDGCVIATAGNLLSIGTPHHRVDTVFVRSQYTNQQKPGGKTWGKNLLARVPGHRALKNWHFEIFYIISFSSRCQPKVTFWVFCTQNRKYFFGIFSRISIKKTHPFKWPVSVDWQSADCESQILMVLSPLPLAICFPSGLHDTDQTLKLREVNTGINRSRKGNFWKKTYAPECPVTVDSHVQKVNN